MGWPLEDRAGQRVWWVAGERSVAALACTLPARVVWEPKPQPCKEGREDTARREDGRSRSINNVTSGYWLPGWPSKSVTAEGLRGAAVEGKEMWEALEPCV